jgi:hypothetical protein
MMLAGIPVRDELVLELARLVDDDALAERFEVAYGHQVKTSAPTSRNARRSSGR